MLLPGCLQRLYDEENLTSGARREHCTRYSTTATSTESHLHWPMLRLHSVLGYLRRILVYHAVSLERSDVLIVLVPARGRAKPNHCHRTS